MGIAYSPDGLNFASAGDSCIEIRNSTTGKLVKQLPNIGWATHCLAYGHDGRRIVTGDRDGAVKVIDISTGH